MVDCPLDDEVLLFKVVTLDVTVQLSERLHGALFVTSSSVVPGGFGDEGPEEDHETDGRPEHSHGEQVVVRVFLVELLHHDGDLKLSVSRVAKG